MLSEFKKYSFLFHSPLNLFGYPVGYRNLIGCQGNLYPSQTKLPCSSCHKPIVSNSLQSRHPGILTWLSINLSDAKFHNGSYEFTWAQAIANDKVKAYSSYYDSSSATASLRKYKYLGVSGVDDDVFRRNKGYWVYMNEAGNLTLPSAGGSLSGESYDWSKLRFWNGSEELNITAAGNATYGWVQTTLRYWGYDSINEEWTFRNIMANPGLTGKTTISSLEGIFVYSNVDNLTLIRQN